MENFARSLLTGIENLICYLLTDLDGWWWPVLAALTVMSAIQLNRHIIRVAGGYGDNLYDDFILDLGPKWSKRMNPRTCGASLGTTT